MMNKFKSQLSAFRIPIIILVIVIVAVVALKVVGAINGGGTSDTEITGIEAENETEYSTIEDVEMGDFTVYAVHEDGVREAISAEACELDTEDTVPIGSAATVTISWVGTEEEPVDEVLSCEAEISVKREKVVGVQCGYPEVSDVTAVYYSNGELCFEGEGDVMTFSEGDAPWLSLEDTTIYSVSFEDGVTPTNMNYWFEGLDTLVYCDAIPSSVKTMVETFSGCSALEDMAEWSECTELLDITSCYASCSSLIGTSQIPSSVKIASYAFENCSSLKSTPDMSGAKSLTMAQGMFQECSKLINVTMCPKVQDMEAMFSGCINLKNMPELPDTVTNINSAFSDCLSLESLTEIPSGVEDMGSAFSGCEMLEGSLTINTECENYSGMFSGAALATTLDLNGSSHYLDVYAATCDSGNVTVNGEKADTEVSYGDIEDSLETEAEASDASAGEAAADDTSAETTAE